jgi:hypothetical protein
MNGRWLRLPLALLMRFVLTRPYLKLQARRLLAQAPLLARLVQRLTRQSSYQAPQRRAPLQGAAHLTTRAQRLHRLLRKAAASRLP